MSEEIQEKNRSLGSRCARLFASNIFWPVPWPVMAIAGITAFGTSPTIPVMWSVAAATATGVATGYGAKLSGRISNAVATIVACVDTWGVGNVGKDSLKEVFSKYIDGLEKIQAEYPKVNKANLERFKRSGIKFTGRDKFIVGSSVIGAMAGAIATYNVAKSSIDQLVSGHFGQQHSSVEQIQPTRLAQDALQHNGKTYMVVQNG